MKACTLLVVLVAVVECQRLTSWMGKSPDMCAYYGNDRVVSDGTASNVCASKGRSILSHTIIAAHASSPANRQVVEANLKNLEILGQNLQSLQNWDSEGHKTDPVLFPDLNPQVKVSELCVGNAITKYPDNTEQCVCDPAFQALELWKRAHTKETKQDRLAMTSTTGYNLTYTFGVDWATKGATLEQEDYPRPVCWKLLNAGDAVTFAGDSKSTFVVFSGFFFTTVYNADCAVAASDAASCSSAFAGRSADLVKAHGLESNEQRKALFYAGRSTCCAAPMTAGTFKANQCINADLQGCCAGVPYNLNTEKCCTSGIISDIQEGCPCTSNAGCSLESLETECCTATKYSYQVANFAARVEGRCFNPNFHRCCNTGDRYDPGSQQCCPINGLQTLDVPCPCGADADCAGGQVGKAGSCCKQNYPAAGFESCDIWDNFPSGSGHYATQRCLGVCIDLSYQTCCNGAVCRAGFESCCNSTCCNKFTSTCAIGNREGSGLNRYNTLNFNDADGVARQFRQCTEVENLNPIRAFFVFVLPASLLTATLACLALVLVFANKASARSFSVLERFMVVLSLFTALMSCTLFFSPVYKYGVVLVLASLVTITSAALRVKYLNVVCVAALGLTLLFVIDPFVGNALGTMSSLRIGDDGKTTTDHSSAGLLHSTGRLFHSFTPTDLLTLFSESGTNYKATPLAQLSLSTSDCTRFYDYFSMDDQLADIARRDNPIVSTFGFCARGFIFTLLMIEAVILLFVLLLFVLSLLALLIRFRKDYTYDDVELEAVVQ